MPRQRVGPKELLEDIARVKELIAHPLAMNRLGITSRDDKFATFALICGPPTTDFRWDKQRAADFTRLAEELFGIKQDRDIRGLYTLYENWYAVEDLDRMLAERQAQKKAGDT